MANIVASTLERRVFQTADGRILGSEYRIDTWFEPFTGGETATTETIVATSGPFYDMPEAGRWVDELRARQQIERAQAFEERIRTEPELRKVLQIVLPSDRSPAVDIRIPRDEEGRCVCGSTAGDEFCCLDCGAEVAV